MNTIHNIRDIKFNPEHNDIEVPDASKRFGLELKTVKLKNFSDGSYMFLGVIILVFGMGFYMINATYNKIVMQQYRGVIYNMLNKTDFEAQIEK